MHRGIFTKHHMVGFMTKDTLIFSLRDKEHWYHGKMYSRTLTDHNHMVIIMFYYLYWVVCANAIVCPGFVHQCIVGYYSHDYRHSTFMSIWSSQCVGTSGVSFGHCAPRPKRSYYTGPFSHLVRYNCCWTGVKPRSRTLQGFWEHF